MSQASTRTLCFSPPRRQSCLSSTWRCPHSTKAPGKRRTACHTATWLTRRRRRRLSTFLQTSCQRRYWLVIISSHWSKCKMKMQTIEEKSSCIPHQDGCCQMFTAFIERKVTAGRGETLRPLFFLQVDHQSSDRVFTGEGRSEV